MKKPISDSSSMYGMYQSLFPEFYHSLMTGKHRDLLLKKSSLTRPKGVMLARSQSRREGLKSITSGLKATSSPTELALTSPIADKCLLDSASKADPYPYSAASKALFDIKELVEQTKKRSGSSNSSSKSEMSSSARSTAATVSGKFCLERAHECLKSKLKQEGYSESHIAKEMSCHLSPMQAREHQRRGLHSKWSKSTSTSVQEPAYVWYEPRSRTKKRADPSSEAGVRMYQRSITQKLVLLQKARDRGELSNAQFESLKEKIIFSRIFNRSDDGQIRLRRPKSGYHASSVGFRQTKLSEMRGGWERLKTRHKDDVLVNNDLDFKDFDGLNDDDDDDDAISLNDGACVTDSASPTVLNDDIDPSLSAEEAHVVCRLRIKERLERQSLQYMCEAQMKSEQEYHRQVKNQQRRSMLMRRFDLRAPPEERIFHQDTNLSGSVSCEEQSTWEVWSSALHQLPHWMCSQHQVCRSFFPDNLRKVVCL